MNPIPTGTELIRPFVGKSEFNVTDDDGYRHCSGVATNDLTEA